MEWLDGVALGARVVRSPELDEIRPKLAYLCGEILAKIHAIDLQATGLDQKLDVFTGPTGRNQLIAGVGSSTFSIRHSSARN